MAFETVATGRCRSYLIGCEASCAAALIDPELSQIDRYIALAGRDGLRIRRLKCFRPMSISDTLTRPLLRNWPAIRGCRNATAARSSR